MANTNPRFRSRIASFFIFGQVHRSGDSLLIEGRVRAFSVNPAEAGGLANINAKPFNDNVTIRLRADTPWAEVNARRTMDVGIIRSVLRRTGEVKPSAALALPDPPKTPPYSTWDPRSLWMLDFMRRDLRDPDFALDTVLMAHFLAPKIGEPEPEDTDEEDEVDAEQRSRRPTLDAVRLFGNQLQDHPEACQRIVSPARLRDLELRVRNIYDRQHNLSKLIRFRLSWDDDHLAVLSGVSADGHTDENLHSRMVRRVRFAAARQLDGQAMQFTLRQIERRAAAGEVTDDDPSVLDDENAEAS